MNILTINIETPDHLVEALNKLLEAWGSKQGETLQIKSVSKPENTQIQAPVVPTSAPSYTKDQLAAAAGSLIEKGSEFMQLLRDLLASFGANKLDELPPEKYGEFAVALRSLGAQI